MEKENVYTLNKYHKRYIRWTDKALSQFSFFNNLILAISIGLLSLGYNSFNFHDIQLTFNHIDWYLTISLFSFILIGVSLLIGSYLAFIRLYNFRITRNICRIRYQYFNLFGNKLDDHTPKEYSLGQRMSMIVSLILERYPNVRLKSQIELNSNTQASKSLESDFNLLKELSYNLDLISWRSIKWQFFFILSGLILFFIVKFI